MCILMQISNFSNFNKREFVGEWTIYKGKSVPLQAWSGPAQGFQEIKVPRFHDNGTGRW